jgi:uncharacterized protein (DUF427 family)
MTDDNNDQRLLAAAAQWRYTGRDRPAFAQEPAAGQESVWDYPRPPRIAADPREVVVSFEGEPVARTRRALRVLETASPPTFYLPEADIVMAALQAAAGASYCEWKGRAAYWTVLSLRVTGRALPRVAWSYPQPESGFEALRGHIAFYPAPLQCFVDGERVRPQPGRFYAGWVTAEIVGPFKGEAGSEGW